RWPRRGSKKGIPARFVQFPHLLAPQTRVGQRELRATSRLAEDDVDEAPLAPAHHARVVLPCPREAETVGSRHVGVEAAQSVNGSTRVPQREAIVTPNAKIDLHARFGPTAHTCPPLLEQRRLRPGRQ